jgi:hypothetical protein
MFLIRSAFWLSIVVLLIPADPGTGHEAPGASAINALAAARGAVADLAGMCARRPEVCSEGGSALQSFGARAGTGAQWIYETIGGLSASTAPPSTRGTLTPTDTTPLWRAPAARERKA